VCIYWDKEQCVYILIFIFKLEEASSLAKYYNQSSLLLIFTLDVISYNSIILVHCHLLDFACYTTYNDIIYLNTEFIETPYTGADEMFLQMNGEITVEKLRSLSCVTYECMRFHQDIFSIVRRMHRSSHPFFCGAHVAHILSFKTMFGSSLSPVVCSRAHV
jgi:hypothetical protein